MGKIKQLLGAFSKNLIFQLSVVLVLLIPTAAKAMPIAYQFHGEVFEVEVVNSWGGRPQCSSPPCEPAVTVGQNYIGFLIWNIDTVGRGFWDIYDFYLGGVPYYSLTFDNFVVIGDNTKAREADDLTILSSAGITRLGIRDFQPQGAGIYQGGGEVDYELFSYDPDEIPTTPIDFPENLDNFSFGELEVVTYTVSKFVDPFSNTDFVATIEDFRRVGAAVPAPAAIWLFGTGLFGLIGVKWRRKMA